MLGCETQDHGLEGDAALMMMMMGDHGGGWTTAKIDHNHRQVMMELSLVLGHQN